MAILLGKPQAERCAEVLERETQVLVSAGTLAEALIVARRRNVDDELSALIKGLGLEVAPVTAAVAERVAQAYARCDDFLNQCIPAGHPQ